MSRYPEIRAGQRITGEMLTGMQFEEIVKQSGTSRNTITKTPDPELQFQVEANAVYFVEWHISYTCPRRDHIAFAWGVPSGSTGLKRILGADWHGDSEGESESGATYATDGDGVVRITDTSSSLTDGGVRVGVHGFTTSSWYGSRPSGNQLMIVETGTVITGSTADTLSLDWGKAKNNAGGTAFATVASFSYARLKRVS